MAERKERNERRKEGRKEGGMSGKKRMNGYLSQVADIKSFCIRIMTNKRILIRRKSSKQGSRRRSLQLGN